VDREVVVADRLHILDSEPVIVIHVQLVEHLNATDMFIGRDLQPIFGLETPHVNAIVSAIRGFVVIRIDIKYITPYTESYITAFIIIYWRSKIHPCSCMA
jgi:hypothetical protein